MSEDIQSSNGKTTWHKMDLLVRNVLAVPHEEIVRREAEYKKQSLANPNRRGPKRKTKPAASLGHVVDAD
jgi:hypothetical protein